MKRFLMVSLLLSVLVSACGAGAVQGEEPEEEKTITVYKLPT